MQEAPHPHPLSQKTPFHPANNNSCICVVCVCSIKSCRYWCFSPKSKGATEDVEGCCDAVYWSHDGRLALHYHSKNAKWFLDNKSAHHTSRIPVLSHTLTLSQKQCRKHHHPLKKRPFILQTTTAAFVVSVSVQSRVVGTGVFLPPGNVWYS